MGRKNAFRKGGKNAQLTVPFSLSLSLSLSLPLSLSLRPHGAKVTLRLKRTRVSLRILFGSAAASGGTLVQRKLCRHARAYYPKVYSDNLIRLIFREPII